MDELTLIAQATEINKKNNAGGVIHANKARTKKKKSRDGSEDGIESSNVEEESGGSDNVKAMKMKVKRDMAKMICYNCCKPGHGSRSCTQPRATCDECGRQHHSKMHTIILDMEKKNKGNRPKAYKTNMMDGMQAGYYEN